MKNFKKITILLACISLIISIVFILQTYAKYATSVSGTASTSIARWNILVNELSIKNNSDISSIISPIFEGSTHIAKDVIAPGATRIL